MSLLVAILLDGVGYYFHQSFLSSITSYILLCIDILNLYQTFECNYCINIMLFVTTWGSCVHGSLFVLQQKNRMSLDWKRRWSYFVFSSFHRLNYLFHLSCHALIINAWTPNISFAGTGYICQVVVFHEPVIDLQQWTGWILTI